MHRTMVRSRPRPQGRGARNKVARARRVVGAEHSRPRPQGRARGIKSPAGLNRPRPQGRGHMSKVPRAEKR